jgi:hypothetical protein
MMSPSTSSSWFSADVVIIVGFYLLSGHGVNANPNGAPDSACADMTPGHGINAQTSFPPYTVTVFTNTYQPNSGQTVTVTIHGTEASFEGFLLKARQQSTSATVGNFICRRVGLS